METQKDEDHVEDIREIGSQKDYNHDAEHDGRIEPAQDRGSEAEEQTPNTNDHHNVPTSRSEKARTRPRA